MRKPWPLTCGKPSWKPGCRTPCAGWLLHPAPGKPKSPSATQAPYPAGLRKVDRCPAANPRRGQWTSHRQPVAALRASEVVISSQPCEGHPLAQAGCTKDHRASRDRSLRCRLLTRRACARLGDFSAANPRRGQCTSLRWLVAALCASAVAVLPQPCEGDPLAQAGSPGRSRLRRDNVVSRSVRFSVTTLSGQEAGPTGCALLRRASRHRPRRHRFLTRQACAGLADFAPANPRRGQWTSPR